METQHNVVNDHTIYIINGNLEGSNNEQISTVRINKTADKTAYMREYMRPYIKQYRADNLEHCKMLDKRKVVKKKMRAFGIEVANEEIDTYPLEDWSRLHQYLVAKKEISSKPYLMKHVPE